MAENLEKRANEKIREERTLPDGSKLILMIYPLSNVTNIGGKKGQIVIEKVLRVELPKKYGSRTSSARKSWDIPEEEYWKIFRSATSYDQMKKVILELNEVTDSKWDRNI